MQVMLTGSAQIAVTIITTTTSCLQTTCFGGKGTPDMLEG